jgi:hypothetical protein
MSAKGWRQIGWSVVERGEGCSVEEDGNDVADGDPEDRLVLKVGQEVEVERSRASERGRRRLDRGLGTRRSL